MIYGKAAKKRLSGGAPNALSAAGNLKASDDWEAVPIASSDVQRYIERMGLEDAKNWPMKLTVHRGEGGRRDFARRTSWASRLKRPRWLGPIAYKYPARQETTVIREIQVSVGRTGVLTPFAVFEPVQIGGVTVTKSTLHNMDEVARLGVHAGDTVLVERAGKVIPHVLKVVKARRGRKRVRDAEELPRGVERVCIGRKEKWLTAA